MRKEKNRQTQLLRPIVRIVCLAGLLGLGTIAADGYSEALSYLNALREAAGAGKLHMDTRLRRAAYAHARYLASTGERGHRERPGNREFTGMLPQSRLEAAGYPVRAVVENISFAERSYRESIGHLFGTIYHRLAFLDPRIDRLGAARAGRRNSVFVYDMSLSALIPLCRRSWARQKLRGRVVRGVCSGARRPLPYGLFAKALRRARLRSASVILFPYPGARNVGCRMVHERPDPLGGRVGYPVTVIFNPARYRRVRLKRLHLYRAKEGTPVPARIFKRSVDPHRRLDPWSFALVPLHPLSERTSYRVELLADTEKGRVARSWEFVTRSRCGSGRLNR